MRTLACIVSMCACSAAMAGPVYFSYADPGTGREFVYTEGDATHLGRIQFNSANPVQLMVDGGAAGFGTVTYPTALSINLRVHEVVMNGSAMQAAVEGTFRFNDGVSDILIGEMMAGSLLTIGSTGSLTANSALGSLSLTAGGSLLAQLGGNQFEPSFGVSFSLSALIPSPMGINGFNYIESFSANSAFSGSADIPAPGAAALAGLAGLLGLRRRR